MIRDSRHENSLTFLPSNNIHLATGLFPSDVKTHPVREVAAPACKLQAQRDRTVDAQANMPGLFTRDLGGVGTYSFSIVPVDPKSFGTSSGSMAKITLRTQLRGAQSVWKFGSGSR